MPNGNKTTKPVRVYTRNSARELLNSVHLYDTLEERLESALDGMVLEILSDHLDMESLVLERLSEHLADQLVENSREVDLTNYVRERKG